MMYQVGRWWEQLSRDMGNKRGIDCRQYKNNNENCRNQFAFVTTLRWPLPAMSMINIPLFLGSHSPQPCTWDATQNNSTNDAINT